MRAAITIIVSFLLSLPLSAAPLCKAVFTQQKAQVCGEHCGVTRAFRMGEWSSDSDGLSKTIVSSLDPSQYAQIYYDNYGYHDGFIPRLVIFDTNKKKLNEETLPPMEKGVGVFKSIMSPRFIALNINDANGEWLVKIVDRKTGSFVVSDSGEISSQKFYWKSSANQISYADIARGKIETLTLEGTIKTIKSITDSTENESSIKIDFTDSPDQVFIDINQLLGNPSYKPLKITGPLLNQRQLLATDSINGGYLTQEISNGRHQIKLFNIEHPDRALIEISVDNIQSNNVQFSPQGHFLAVSYLRAGDARTITKIFDLRSKTSPTAPSIFEYNSNDPTPTVHFATDEASFILASLDNGQFNLQNVSLRNGKTLSIEQNHLLEKLGPNLPPLSPQNLSSIFKDRNGVSIIPNSQSIYLTESRALIDFSDKSILSLQRIKGAHKGTYNRSLHTFFDSSMVGNEYTVLTAFSLERTNFLAPTKDSHKTTSARLKEVFQSDGTEGKNFVSLLRSFFESGEYKNDPKLTTELILWMGANAPLTVSKYLNSDSLLKIISSGEIEIQSEEHHKKIFKLSKRFMQNLIYDTYDLPISIIPVLKTYFTDNPAKDETRDQLVQMATFYSNKLRLRDPFLNIDDVVRINLLAQSLRRMMNLNFRNYTDISLHPQGQVIAYGTQSIDGQPLNDYGISAKAIGTVSMNQVGQQTFTWTFDGRRQNATVRTSTIQVSDLTPPRRPSPNYQELRPNGKMAGIIGIAANLGEGFARDLAMEYQSYFENRGFTFSLLKFDQGTAALDFLTERIQSGEVGYFIREGHGEYRNDYVVSVTPHMEIAKGKNPATHETIYILLPGSTNTNLPSYNPGISFAAFGEALRTRPNPDTEFIFVEGKCSGAYLLLSHIQKIGAKGFTPLGSSKMLDTFTDSPSSAMFAALEGLRNNRPYAEMNSATAEAQLITPDSDAYHSLVDSGLQNFVPTNVEIIRNLNVDGAQP